MPVLFSFLISDLIHHSYPTIMICMLSKGTTLVVPLLICLLVSLASFAPSMAFRPCQNRQAKVPGELLSTKRAEEMRIPFPGEQEPQVGRFTNDINKKKPGQGNFQLFAQVGSLSVPTSTTPLTYVRGADDVGTDEYWYDGRIHNLGNIGFFGGLHAALAPIGTKVIDNCLLYTSPSPRD